MNWMLGILLVELVIKREIGYEKRIPGKRVGTLQVVGKMSSVREKPFGS